jgi:branched-chain amino acid transport system substrate-binding protein
VGRRHRRWLAGLAVSSFVLGACASSTGNIAANATPKGNIRIGLVAPFTGPFAPSTVGFKNSAEVGIDQINKKGGVNGRKLELIVKDDGGQPNQDPQLVQELSDQGVHIFIEVWTAGVLATKPLMSSLNFILFTANPPAVQNDPAQLPYDFNFFPPNQYATDAITSYAIKKGQKKWALLSDTTNQFQEYVKLITDKAPSQGAQIVINKQYDPATTDFSSVAKQIKDSNPDAVMFFAAGSPIPRFLQAAKAAGITATMYGGYGGSSANLTTAPQDVLQNQYYFVSNSTGLLDSSGQPLIKEYGDVLNLMYAAYGKKANVGGGVTWDLFQAIVYAIQKSGGDDPAKMRQALEKTASMGGVGFTSPKVKFKFSSKDHGGFPADQVQLAKTVGSPDWPGMYPAAPAT